MMIGIWTFLKYFDYCNYGHYLNGKKRLYLCIVNVTKSKVNCIFKTMTDNDDDTDDDDGAVTID